MITTKPPALTRVAALSAVVGAALVVVAAPAGAADQVVTEVGAAGRAAALAHWTPERMRQWVGDGSLPPAERIGREWAGPVPPGAAKAALVSFTKSVSEEFGPHGVRANAINPGPVATDLWLGSGGVAETIAATTGANPESVAGEAAAHAVTGRFTKPAEVANLAALLASDRVAGNITGATFAIDGGYTAETH
ncbi:SDR family oxidoreductase [Amycolatopsis mongoliensis]|uniref:SDR family oxidoreductase n=1 Tax=Amycolatopsis mongoliensis TaxID=715475 RepID=A0A9Y2NBU3_9PSEU|nr:SDR family oxidoreductase [Amycolatopsis sp. 4-36]WIX98876.1 SDR family oxidoreductase [Amycolatopsis sp. 4-36]